MYYQLPGDKTLASPAANFREKQIAKARRPCPIRDFRGVDSEHVARLEAARIVDVEQMLEAGKTPEDRQRLAAETGIPLDAILELVKLSDLSRIGGKSARARPYYDASVDTPGKMVQWGPEDLRKLLGVCGAYGV